MNFDFLKDLYSLGHLYEFCTDAEKLAKTMPIQSIFTARKSAESLAKFIYLTAHNEQMISMDFVDILNDQVFRNFINDRNVMKAFHNVRKSGNRAVHGDEFETTEEAIDVLEDLHYVVGETACMLGLIDHYPNFDNKIPSFYEYRFVDNQEIEKLATEMFLEYIKKYDAWKERECYYNNKIDNIITELDSLSSPYKFVPGNVDLNEVIEFKKKPTNKFSIKPLQAYFGFLAVRAIKKARGELYGELEDRDLNYKCELTIYGDHGYTTSDLVQFIYGILYDIPESDGFKIMSEYYGPSIEPWFDVNVPDRKEQFIDEIVEIGKSESFTYTTFQFLYNHGDGLVQKFENGTLIDLEEQCSKNILDKVFEENWWTWGLDLNVEFDFDKYPDILNALRECVKQNIPNDQLQFCESLWDDGEEEILCSDVCWNPKTLREIQDFFDRINLILKPILKECTGNCTGKWYITKPPFAVAFCEWGENGFYITGTELSNR